MFIQSAHFSLRNEKIFVSVGKKKDKSPFRRQYDAEMVYTQFPRYRRQVWHLSVDQRTAVTETRMTELTFVPDKSVKISKVDIQMQVCIDDTVRW